MIATNNARLPILRVVILAAGQSRRLGSAKALARVHGASLLRTTARTVSGLSHRPAIVIVPARAGSLRQVLRGMAIQWVVNRNPFAGQSASVRLGLGSARDAAAVLLLPCDLVHLKRCDLLRLIHRWRGRRRHVVAHRIGSGRAAVPLILPRELFAVARGITGDVGLRDVLRALPKTRQTLLPLPSATADVDTRQDLDTARRYWRGAVVPISR